ncbi:hypothetical protein DVU_2080 [Nitratidesulfovibrio vulgaris str. Hildenborough]|uniref:Uncharacterized protein n=1 Tax=Nitratidesulfovibrio vulgaris (strain ATCC 29579 / DSM 644 / CCUG 34227 / NCIMB 8303 / VKM B-1760 / Hildenborough) TaxID=882 RepID=Q72AB7_NITV2|nr:hypothetical protein DVU_2080 [Nitratidesulfovibrio vulgaris str. Hildenborough]
MCVPILCNTLPIPHRTPGGVMATSSWRLPKGQGMWRLPDETGKGRMRGLEFGQYGIFVADTLHRPYREIGSEGEYADVEYAERKKQV